MRKWFDWAKRNWMLTGIFILVMFGMVLALYFFGYVDRLYQMNSFGTEAVNQNTVYFVIKIGRAHV